VKPFACLLVLAAALVAGVTRDVAHGEPGVAAPTIRFRWLEESPNAYGWQRMTYRIQSVTYGRTGWSIRAVITNRSRQRIQIRSRDSHADLWRSKNFAVWGPGPVCDPEPVLVRCGHSQTEARRFAPRPYGITLRPGDSWRGSFGGRERLRRNVRYYISFGVFVPERGRPFSWHTQRSFRLR
jgi:hypothetical protein